MKNKKFLLGAIVAGIWLVFGFSNSANADSYNCGAAGQIQGCRVCRQTLGSGGNLANHWADDSARCAAGQACVNGACVNGQPPLPSVYDVTISKSGNTATAKNSAGSTISSGADYTAVIRNAIAATPDNGSLYIGTGTYDGLRADQNVPINNVLSGSEAHYYTALSLRGKNIHIYGAGMGQTVLKLGDNQYYSGHQALIIFASNGLGLGYSAFTLANITLDGNKDAQSPFWYDGAGLILTGGERTGGKFFNIELKNSPNTGMYLGNNGSGWEAYAYLDNIYSHDNRQAGLVFDDVEKIKAGRLKFANDGTIASGTVALQIVNVGDHKLDLAIDGAEINNGILKIGNEEYPGAGGITIKNLKIDTNISNLGLIGAVYIKNNHNSPYSLADRGQIILEIDSITTNTASKNHAVWIEQEPIPVILRGGLINAGVAVYANQASSLTIEGTRLKSAFNSLIAQNSTVHCEGCVFEPTAGQYMYSSIGGASIYFNNSSTVSREKTDVSSGTVYGSLSENSCANECSSSGIRRCSGNGTQTCALSGGCLKWSATTACGENKTCSNGDCVAVCVPATCASLGKNCGSWSNNCGGTLNCGSCNSGQTCSNGQCSTVCVPATCASLGKNCGYWSNNCGGTLNCGSCNSGQTCSNGQCSTVCVPATCASLGYGCGTASDGCGGTISCGDCSAGKACLNNNCSTVCFPKTCASLGNYKCGLWSDGCGKTVNCGACETGKACSDGECVANCAPQTTQKCDNGNLYWYNSCGIQEGLAQNCGNNELTSNYRCSGKQIQRQTLKQGCSDNACFSIPQWQDTCTCATACSGGKCVYSESVAAETDTVPEDSEERFGASPKLSRAEILAKIEETKKLLIEAITRLISELQKSLW